LLRRLIVDHAGPEPVHVFLPDPPDADDPPGEPVRLRELAPLDWPRLLGRSVWHPTFYREFRSAAELLVEGYEPVGRYRVCESWADYLDPWSSARSEEPTALV
jgi:hypothetical protein